MIPQLTPFLLPAQAAPPCSSVLWAKERRIDLRGLWRYQIYSLCKATVSLLLSELMDEFIYDAKRGILSTNVTLEEKSVSLCSFSSAWWTLVCVCTELQHFLSAPVEILRYWGHISLQLECHCALGLFCYAWLFNLPACSSYSKIWGPFLGVSKSLLFDTTRVPMPGTKNRDRFRR